VPAPISRRNALAAALVAFLAGCTRVAARGRGSAATGVALGPPTLTPLPTASATTTPSASVTVSSAVAPVTGGPATEIGRGPAERNEVALTFHGQGDLAMARAILKTLSDRQATATVFVVGTWLDANPQMAQEILAGGHEVGNHTWSHPTLSALDVPGVTAEIVRCQQVIQKLTGIAGGYFRQSAAQHPTDRIREVAGSVGYPVCLSYSLDSMDWTDPGAAAVRANVAACTPGEIISLHFGHQSTVTAIGSILDDLAGRGLKPVTVRTLLRP
jgi:peptidoglycan/xylan/chitin deacetylase (PgdA/CDA1 family)